MDSRCRKLHDIFRCSGPCVLLRRVAVGTDPQKLRYTIRSGLGIQPDSVLHVHFRDSNHSTYPADVEPFCESSRSLLYWRRLPSHFVYI